MAQYRGRVRGSRGEATRLGGKSAGMQAGAYGWNLGGSVYMQWNEEKQRDEVVLTVNGGSNHRVHSRVVGKFYLDGDKIKRAK